MYIFFYFSSFIFIHFFLLKDGYLSAPDNNCIKDMENWRMLKPADIARSLAAINHRLLRKISLPSLLGNEKSNFENSTTPLNKFSEWFNCETNWVRKVLTESCSVHECSELIQKFILIIHKCIAIHNFDSAMAIYSTLTVIISFLKSAFSLVSQKSQKLMSEFEKSLSFKSNYKEYREMLRNASYPCIPFFGLFLRDITHKEDGAVKVKEDGDVKKINFSRLSSIGENLIQFRNYQIAEYGDELSSLSLERQISEVKPFDNDTLYAKLEDIENRHVSELASKKRSRHSLRDVRESLQFTIGEKQKTTDLLEVPTITSSNETTPKKEKKRKSKFETAGPLDMRSLAATYDPASSSSNSDKEKSPKKISPGRTTTDLTKRMRPKSQLFKPVKEEKNTDTTPKSGRKKLTRSVSSQEFNFTPPELEGDEKSE